MYYFLLSHSQLLIAALPILLLLSRLLIALFPIIFCCCPKYLLLLSQIFIAVLFIAVFPIFYCCIPDYLLLYSKIVVNSLSSFIVAASWLSFAEFPMIFYWTIHFVLLHSPKRITALLLFHCCITYIFAAYPIINCSIPDRLMLLSFFIIAALTTIYCKITHVLLLHSQILLILSLLFIVEFPNINCRFPFSLLLHYQLYIAR